MKKEPDKGKVEEYWDQRFREGSTGWDIGSPSRPIKEYIDQLKNKGLRILIPGCGNAWEGGHLFENGFRNTYLLDISPTALAGFKKRVPGFPEDHLLQENFFDHQGQYDLIIEQTFFCALHPSLRTRYAEQMANLLKPGGKLVGLLFEMEKDDGPPYGGDRKEYIRYFKPYFHIRVLEEAYNSIKPREGAELFVLLVKRQEAGTKREANSN